MRSDSPLSIRYRSHDRVRRLRDVLRYHLEDIALGFDHWGESRVYGPGMYLALVVGPSVESYANAMGDNRWPEGETREPLADPEGFAAAATEIAYSCDGAVVISVDGVVNRQLVRFRTEDVSPDLDYEPWMGARHMSALDISTRPDVVTTLTLSQESGRITVFESGDFESIERGELGGRWRIADESDT